MRGSRWAHRRCVCVALKPCRSEARHPHGRLSSTATPQAQCGGQWFGRPLSDFGSWLASRSSRTKQGWKSWGLPCCSYCRPVPDTAIGQTWTCSRHQPQVFNELLLVLLCNYLVREPMDPSTHAQHNMHRNKALPWGTRLDHLAPEIRSCVPFDLVLAADCSSMAGKFGG